MIFNSRRRAGQLLAEELKRRGVKPDLVLGLARGGMVVAAEIAAAFEVPLEPLIVRKISPPLDPEFAIGAIAAMPGSEPSIEGSEPSIYVWWDKDTVRRLDLSPAWQKQQIRAKKIEISSYLSQINIAQKNKRSRIKLSNIVLVDDGAATGATMLAAIKGKKEEGKRKKEKLKIIVALPVASTDAAAKVKQEADETVILSIDPCFRAVGQYYRSFEQVGWDEVRGILKEFWGRTK